MISTIKIQKTPRSGPVQSLTLNGYSGVLSKISWTQAIYIWFKIYLTTIGWPPILLRLSVFSGLGYWGLGVLHSFLLIKIKVYGFLWLLRINCVRKYQKTIDSIFVRKQSYMIVLYKTWQKQDNHHSSMDNSSECTSLGISSNNINKNNFDNSP